jgi:hypothetical protein
MTGDSRRGRRDNGLDAAAFVPLLDVDPRVGEHLLDVLGSAGVPAYLEPSADVEPYTRALSLPSPPTDRLWVDRDQRRQARMIVDAETPHGPRPVPPSRDDEPSHGLADAEEERAWQEIIAGFDAPPSPPATDPGGGRAPGRPPYGRDDDPGQFGPDGPGWFGEPPTDAADPGDRTPGDQHPPDPGQADRDGRDRGDQDRTDQDRTDQDRTDQDRSWGRGRGHRGRDSRGRDSRDRDSRDRDSRDRDDRNGDRDDRAPGDRDPLDHGQADRDRSDQGWGDEERGDPGWSDPGLGERRAGGRDPLDRDPLDPRSWLEPGGRSDPLADRPPAYRDREDLIVDPWSDLDTGRRGRRWTRGGPADADPLPSGRDLDRAAEDRARHQGDAAREDAEDVWIDGPPTLDGDDEHFEPPPPPPFPRPSRNTVLAILLVLLGVTLIAVPQVIGMDDRTGLTLGVLSVLGGGVLLVLRLREARDEDGPDDGAVV